jgi:uncharacterized membrane protein YjjP (DUF1212 family)
MCDVPSTAVFCSEFIECFPGTVSKIIIIIITTTTTGILFYMATRNTLPSLKPFPITAGSAILFYYALSRYLGL